MGGEKCSDPTRKPPVFCHGFKQVKLFTCPEQPGLEISRKKQPPPRRVARIALLATNHPQPKQKWTMNKENGDGNPWGKIGDLATGSGSPAPLLQNESE